MTQGSNVGYQPVSLTPPDFDEFLEYKRKLNALIRGELYPQSKVKLVEKPKKKSKDK
jgi:hypothetical protein